MQYIFLKRLLRADNELLDTEKKKIQVTDFVSEARRKLVGF